MESAFGAAQRNRTADSAAFTAASPHATPGEPDAQVDAPDAHVAAALMRLERFLGAIQSARHA
jgi:hypothetical protein